MLSLVKYVGDRIGRTVLAVGCAPTEKIIPLIRDNAEEEFQYQKALSNGHSRRSRAELTAVACGFAIPYASKRLPIFKDRGQDSAGTGLSPIHYYGILG